MEIGEDIIRRQAFGLGGRSSKDKVWFCSAFQKNNCNLASPHQLNIKGVEREVKHVCAACLIKTKKLANHAELSSVCPLYQSKD